MDLPRSVYWAPNPGAQTAFLMAPEREVLMGGAVSGGKTDALWAAPLRWVWSPYHRAILFRRERDDLQEIIDRARIAYEVACPSARWIATRSRFEFPTGAKIWMGASELEKDIEAWKTFEFNFIGFDELTTFTKFQYTYMMSRNRNKAAAALPYQMRAGTNPDGPGHAWVYNRFIKNKEPYKTYRFITEIVEPDGTVKELSTTRKFVPATIFDNPAVGNRDAYIAGMQQMGKGLADALIYGRWDYFRGQMFPMKHGGLKQVAPEIKDPNHYVIRCMDYGWDNPTVVQWLVVYPALEDKPFFEVCYELMLRESSVTVIATMIRQIEATLAHEGVKMPVARSVIDPSVKKREGTSGRSIQDLLEQQGLWFEPAINDRKAGWAWLRVLLEHGQVRYWKGRANYLADSLPKLVRKPGTEDILDKQDDHPADTLRYGAMAFYTQIGGGIEDVRDQETLVTGTRDLFFDQLMARLQQPEAATSFLGEGF